MYDRLEDILYVGVPKVEILESLSYYRVPHYISTNAPDTIIAFIPVGHFVIKYLPSKEDKDIIAKVEITEPTGSQWANTIKELIKQNPEKFIVARGW